MPLLASECRIDRVGFDSRVASAAAGIMRVVGCRDFSIGMEQRLDSIDPTEIFVVLYLFGRLIN